MPRTGDPGALNVAFRQRSATVRAGVADGIVSSLHIKEGYFLAFDCERSRLAGWHVLGLSYLEEFCLFESVYWIERTGSCQALLMMMRVASPVGRRIGDGWPGSSLSFGSITLSLRHWLPMASTGHPSMASLQVASSSGVVGCLNT